MQKFCEDCDVNVPTHGTIDLHQKSRLRWCQSCSARYPQSVYLLAMKQICEDCKSKRAHYGMLAEMKRRWCASCGKRWHQGSTSL